MNVVAYPLTPERNIRPFVYLGSNTGGDVQRRKMLNNILLELAVMRSNIEFVICDTFDRELIHSVRRLGFCIEEYPIFTDEFSDSIYYLQRNLRPNIYTAYGLDELQKRAVVRVSHYRRIPFVGI